MNRLPVPAELSQKLMAVNLPMLKQSAPKLVRQMFIGQPAVTMKNNRKLAENSG